jgi:hypothetical protein
MMASIIPSMLSKPAPGPVVPGSGSINVTLSPANAVLVLGTVPFVAGLHANVTPGTYDYSCYVTGYVTQTGQVTVTANNTAQLTITLVASPAPGSIPFTYTGATGTAVQSWTGSSQSRVTYAVTVHNPAQVAESHTLTLMYQYVAQDGSTVGPYAAADGNGAAVTAVVTAQPSDTPFVSVDTKQYSAIFPFGKGLRCDLWLQDEAGNKSPVVTVTD